MSKTFNLTEKQLNFISFMKRECDSRPEMSVRLNSRLDTISVVENNKFSDSDTEHISCHSPRKMIEFLSLFSRDDYFKWYTHKWDQDGQTLESLINQQKKKIQELSKMVFRSENPVNIRTYNQVLNFINFAPDLNKNFPWYGNDGKAYRIGWHSIVGIHLKHPETPVENLILSDGHQFRDYIRLFKTSIEFRTDLGMDGRFNRFIKNSLKRFINGALSVSYSDIFTKIGKDINIYCDIPAIHEALGIICDWIVKYKVNGANVKVDLLFSEESYELKIIHEGSYFSNLKKLANPSGDLDRLRNRLFSVCDLTISADFLTEGEKLQCVSVYLLENKTKRIGKALGPCRIEYNDILAGGVEYTLKFYKS